MILMGIQTEGILSPLLLDGSCQILEIARLDLAARIGSGNPIGTYQRLSQKYILSYHQLWHLPYLDMCPIFKKFFTYPYIDQIPKQFCFLQIQFLSEMSLKVCYPL